MKRLLIPALLALSLPVMAQQKDTTRHVYADLQLLTQGEIRDGGLPVAANGSMDRAAFLLGRNRLVVGYERPHLQIKTIFQHIGVWGQAGKGTFNVQEAWAKLSTNWGLFAQLGRQTLSYDDERILGPNDWAMAGITHDVLRAGYEGHGHKFHTALAWNQNAENTDNGSTFYSGGALPYKTMILGWYHYDLPVAPVGVSLLALNVGMQGGALGKDEHIEWQHIMGGYLKFKPEKWSLEGSYYRQFGRNEKGAVLDAWMASGKATFTPSKVLGFVAGYDFLSGDNTFAVPQGSMIGLIQHDVLRGFSSIYGSHHAFYGAMDFFYVRTFVNGFSPGLQNAYVGTQVQPFKNVSAGLTYHYLAIAAKLQGIGATLGHELEVEASWRFLKDVSLSFGLSYMVGTKNMQLLKRASQDGRLFWTWLSLHATPRIFEHRR